MKIDVLKIDQITPYENNPRKNDSAVEAVMASIKEFGFQQPIVVDSSMVIVVGHTRYKAAKKLGMKTIPVHVAKGLSDQQIRSYRIIDNKTNESADWDDDLLKVELDAISSSEYDFDIFGYSSVDFFENEQGFNNGEHDSDPGSDPEIPDIEIEEKVSLERITVFVEESLKPEFISKLRKIISDYPDGSARVVT